MSIKVLRGPMRKTLTPPEIMRSPPWLLSAGLIAVGFLLIGLSGH
jgi:hypothetical protein